MNAFVMRPPSGLRIFRAREDVSQTTDFTLVIDQAIDLNFGGTARVSLYRQNSKDLFHTNPLISLCYSLGRVVGGCYIDVQEPHFEVCGLVKVPHTSSLVPRLVVARALTEAARLLPEQPTFSAAIRLLPPGWVDAFGRHIIENAASKRLFADTFYFKPYEERSHEFKDNIFKDAHLKDSREADGTYRSLIMRSTARTLDAANEFLAKHGLKGAV